MFCTKCGKKMEDADRFCSYCGKELKAPPAQSLTVEEKENEEPVPAESLFSKYDKPLPKAKPESPIKPLNWKHPFVWLVAIFVIVVLAGKAIGDRGGESGNSSGPYKASESGARYLAKKVIQEFLKAPSTAKFSNVKILDRKKNKFFVRATVDAQNSYGAVLRETYWVIFNVTQEDKYEWNPRYAVSNDVDGDIAEAYFKKQNEW